VLYANGRSCTIDGTGRPQCGASWRRYCKKYPTSTYSCKWLPKQKYSIQKIFLIAWSQCCFFESANSILSKTKSNRAKISIFFQVNQLINSSLPVRCVVDIEQSRWTSSFGQCTPTWQGVGCLPSGQCCLKTWTVLKAIDPRKGDLKGPRYNMTKTHKDGYLHRTLMHQFWDDSVVDLELYGLVSSKPTGPKISSPNENVGKLVIIL